MESLAAAAPEVEDESLAADWSVVCGVVSCAAEIIGATARPVIRAAAATTGRMDFMALCLSMEVLVFEETLLNS